MFVSELRIMLQKRSKALGSLLNFPECHSTPSGEEGGVCPTVVGGGACLDIGRSL